MLRSSRGVLQSGLGLSGLALCAGIATMSTAERVKLEAEHTEDGFYKVEVLRNKALGPNTRLLRLKLDDPEACLEYSPGSFVYVRGTTFSVAESFPFGKQVCKPYLVVQPLDRKGHFDLIVKTFPYPQGDTSRYLAESSQGDLVEVKGPISRNGGSILNDTQAPQNVAIITGGSGLTAAIQLVRSLLPQDDETEPKHRISILASDKTSSDLFYMKELDRLSERFPENLTIHRTLTRDAPHNWDQSVGRITDCMVRSHLPEPSSDTLVVVSGPNEFVKYLVGSQAEPNNEKVDMCRVNPAVGEEKSVLGRLGYDNVILL